MSKAACLAIILVYMTEEDTIYQKRKMSIWTKDWLKKEVYSGTVIYLKNLNCLRPLITKTICGCVRRHSVNYWNLLRYENQWWTGDVVQQLANMSMHASNCRTTWLLRSKIQTSLKIVKLLHKQFDDFQTGLNFVVQTVW